MSDPLKMIQCIRYAEHYIHLGRNGLPEISREEFDDIRAKDLPFKKINRLRYDCAQIFSKRAKYAMMKNNILDYLFSFSSASILSPRYTMALIENRLKK